MNAAYLNKILFIVLLNGIGMLYYDYFLLCMCINKF